MLFLDVFMPDRDGLEMLGLLQKHAYDGQIVMMSGADSLYLNMAAASAKARGLRLAGILAQAMPQAGDRGPPAAARRTGLTLRSGLAEQNSAFLGREVGAFLR